jgi:hypothetical protein
VGHIEQDIDTWLSSRPPPEDHTRLWHGTSMQSMNRILRSGIDQTSFQEIGSEKLLAADNFQEPFD